jgi:uncharacterized membrane protein YqjE
MTASPQSALDWEGQTMLDRAGERIGTIEEIFLVEETGRPEWALVKLGRLKTHTTLVPLTSAQPVRDGIKVGYEKDVVSDAPVVDAGEEPSEQQVNAVYRHYGIDVNVAGGDAQASNGSEVPPRQQVVVNGSNGSHGDLRDEPIGDLVKQVSAEAKTLAGQQFKLAKTELTEKAKDVGIGAGMVGGAGYALHLAALGLLLTIIFALATLMQAWLAALIVTVVFAAIAGALALKGKRRIKQAGPPVPEHTIESVKQTIETVKEEATWGLGQTR